MRRAPRPFTGLRIQPLECRLAPAVFTIPAGDTAAFIAAVNASNVNNQPDTIELAAGSTYTFSAAGDSADGGSALPTIVRDTADANTLTIHGNGATVQRSIAAATPTFRLVRTGVFPNNVAVTITNLTFANGDAGTGLGGAVLLQAGDLTLSGCTFTNDRADTGGAVYATTTDNNARFVSISDSTFTGNTATGSNNGGAAGAVYVSGSSVLDLERDTLTFNTAAREGGAVRVQTSSGAITMANDLVANNTANGGNGGGGVFIQGPTTITNTTVRDNVSAAGGGGVWVQSPGSLVLTASTISVNQAFATTASGGGVFSQGPLTVVDSTINGNRAGNGGGIAFFGTATTPGSITYSTIADNRAFFALATGGGIRVSGPTPSLGNTIVAGNTFEATVTNGTGPDIGGPVASLGYNLIQNTSGATVSGTTTGNIIGVAAGLGPLQNNGGPTFTRLPLAGSPALDAGDPAFAPPPATDQRGLPRVRDGRIDIGAVEAAPATVAGVRVNDGSAQRSEVTSLTVTFSGRVNFAGGNANAGSAFSLTGIGGGAVGLAASVATNAAGQTVVTLTFAGSVATDPVSGQNGGALSLADGRYHLAIADGAVTDIALGWVLDGDGNGVAGGAYNSVDDTAGSGAGYHLGLFRLFGDADGNGTVDLADLSALRAAFNSFGNQPAYVASLDANHDGTIDLTDLAEFRDRFNILLFP